MNLPAGAITLVDLGPYSAALISTDALPGITNLAPPTLVLALAGCAQAGVLLLVWKGLERLLARDRTWVPVALFSSRAMQLYLWHVLVMALLVAGVLAAGPVDVLVVPGEWDGWSRCASEVAVVVVADGAAPDDCLRWWRSGAQDVVSAAAVATVFAQPTL